MVLQWPASAACAGRDYEGFLIAGRCIRRRGSGRRRGRAGRRGEREKPLPPAGPSDLVLIEIKSSQLTINAANILRELRVRPIAMSKYCVGVALCHPGVPANPWHRVIRRHFTAKQ